jgi:transcriptional regulator with XRE-family HTH domain
MGHSISMQWLLMEFTNKLIALRKQHGLTQQALADAITSHVNQFKRYDTGTTQPTVNIG